MKILHTADWHIGQLFHEYDRTYEHRQFLDWLAETLRQEQIDVLLISGDVFDLSNPAAASVKMFYTFLSQAVKSNPDIQIIIIAGNHDSATRLESPKPLLESSNIHIVGWVERDARGKIDYSKLIIPVKDKTGSVKAWCMAIPFLRMGDYPAPGDYPNAYAAGVSALYKEAYEYTLRQKRDGHPIIAMGHLHALNAAVTDMDKMERPIMGGVEGIPVSTFPEDIKYIALGHIHKAQCIGGIEHIRYSGSPIPMSFSELNYKHQVVVFDLEEKISDLKSIEVPLLVSLLNVPSTHRPLKEVIISLRQLPDAAGDPGLAPYLEVNVLLDGPEPALRHKIETALTGKYARLAKIDVKYPTATSPGNNGELITRDQLPELQPLEVFSKVYQSRYLNPVPGSMLQLFNQVIQEVNQGED